MYFFIQPFQGGRGLQWNSVISKVGSLFVALLLFFPLCAQVTFSTFPTNQQLYQRNLTTNQANISIQGFMQMGYSTAIVRVYKNDGQYAEKSLDLRYQNSRASFSFNFSLPAELSNYKVAFFGVQNGQEQLLKTAEKVVVGDVIIINGQSNAEARAAAMPQDFDEFSRSYTTSVGWTNMRYSYPGQWGGRLAKNIIQQQGVPVAIFNQAVGGKDIQFFLPSSEASHNYNLLKQRLQAAGISQVTSIVWFQGEGDGWTTELETYKKSLKKLHDAWVQDYQPAYTYIFQIRFRSCGHTKPYVMEAQRQLAFELPKVGIMSSTNVSHDGCHFPYIGGYQDMADNLSKLMRRDIYGIDQLNIEAPNISQITQPSGGELLLEFNNTSSLSLIGNPWSDFELEGSTVTVRGGQVEGNQIRLFLSGQTSSITGVSYLAHSGSASDWIINPNNIGILTFYNIPISIVTTNEPVATSDNEVQPFVEITDCDNLQITTLEDNLTISGLNAPNVTYQIFDFQWKVVEVCSQSCTKETISFDSLPNGRYYVKAQLLSENWQQLCIKEGYYSISTSIATNDICSNISMQTVAGGISISGLQQAPVSSIVVMATDWSTHFYNCWGNACGNEDLLFIPMNVGAYRVNVKYFTESFQQICNKEEIIEVSSNIRDSASERRSRNQASNETLEIYPTITSSNLVVKLNSNSNSVTNLKIISQQGGFILVVPINNRDQKKIIDISHLPKGIYFLNAPFLDGTNLTRKFMIK